MPAVACRMGTADLERRMADGLVGNVDSALGSRTRHITAAQRDAKLEPDGMPDALGREAMAGAGRLAHTARYAVDATKTIRLT